jgi:hypothetical protein
VFFCKSVHGSIFILFFSKIKNIINLLAEYVFLIVCILHTITNNNNNKNKKNCIVLVFVCAVSSILRLYIFFYALRSNILVNKNSQCMIMMMGRMRCACGFNNLVFVIFAFFVLLFFVLHSTLFVAIIF